MKIGILLYSVRNTLQADPIAALEKGGESGYKYIEAANHYADSDPGIGFGLPAAEMKYGIPFYYHNHFHEFQLVEGGRSDPYDPGAGLHEELGARFDPNQHGNVPAVPWCRVGITIEKKD